MENQEAGSGASFERPVVKRFSISSTPRSLLGNDFCLYSSYREVQVSEDATIMKVVFCSEKGLLETSKSFGPGIKDC